MLPYFSFLDSVLYSICLCPLEYKLLKSKDCGLYSLLHASALRIRLLTRRCSINNWGVNGGLRQSMFGDGVLVGEYEEELQKHMPEYFSRSQKL